MRAAIKLTRALRPFSLNPTGTLLRRHLAHFVAAVDKGTELHGLPFWQLPTHGFSVRQQAEHFGGG